VAGNILDPHVVGSIEYSVEHFHSLVVVVLGHQRCGAVEATIESVETGKKAPGSIQSIVRSITPVVKATPRDGLGDDAYVEKVVKANTRSVTSSLLRRSKIVREAVSHKKLMVVPAEYSLDTGKVHLLSPRSDLRLVETEQLLSHEDLIRI
jgi:carbonic anhydrase